MTNAVSEFTVPPLANRAERYRLDHVSDDALHASVKTLAGRCNALTADLLANLAEVEARGIHRERACSSLYTYCVYELRFSEDEAQRRARAARVARDFPVLFEMLADGAIHMTGLLLLAPHLTADNHAELFARARFRTKREIERLVAEVAPRPDVPARVEPLGPHPAMGANRWQAFTASLRGPVRDLRRGVGPGEAPPAVLDDVSPAVLDDVSPAGFGGAATPERVGATDAKGIANDREGDGSSAPARMSATNSRSRGTRAPLRYRVEFTASEEYVSLLEEARNLLQHRVPDRDIARVHEIAMAALVEALRKRRHGASSQSFRHVSGDGPAGASHRSGDGSAGPGHRSGDGAPKGGTERCAETVGGAAPARNQGTDDGGSPLRKRAPAGSCTVSGSETSVQSAPARAPLGDVARSERTAQDVASSSCRRSRAEPSRYVPVAVRREVWRRDEGRCAFVDSSGRRCEERAGLEVHHEHPFARGGPATTENLRLVCRAHNAWFAERDFGARVR